MNVLCERVGVGLQTVESVGGGARTAVSNSRPENSELPYVLGLRLFIINKRDENILVVSEICQNLNVNYIC